MHENWYWFDQRYEDAMFDQGLSDALAGREKGYVDPAYIDGWNAGNQSDSDSD